MFLLFYLKYIAYANNLWCYYIASTVLRVYNSARQCLKLFDILAALSFLVFPRERAMMSSKCHSATVKTPFPSVTAETGIKTFCSPGVLPMQLHRGVFCLLAPSFTLSHNQLNVTEPWLMTFQDVCDTFGYFPLLFMKWGWWKCGGVSMEAFFSPATQAQNNI